MPPIFRIRDVYPGSRILVFFIPDPGSRIPDPKTSAKERGEKKFVFIPYFVATNFTKLKNYLVFEMLKKKIWPSFQRLIELFTQKFVTKLKKYGFGIRVQGSKRHRIPDPDPQHCACHNE